MMEEAGGTCMGTPKESQILFISRFCMNEKESTTANTPESQREMKSAVTASREPPRFSNQYSYRIVCVFLPVTVFNLTSFL